MAHEVLRRDEFRAGLRFGVIAAVACAALGGLARARTGKPLPIAGLAVVAAILAGLNASIGLPDDVLIGSAALLGGGLFAEFFPRHRVAVGVVGCIPGALLLGRSAPTAPGWSAGFVAMTTVVGGAAIATFDRDDGHCVGPVLLALSVAAVWVAVPDTERPLVFLGAAPPLVVVGWPARLAHIGTAGAFAVAGLLAWAAAIGGVGRPSSIIAGAGALGLFLVVPAARTLRIVRRRIESTPAIVMLAMHAACIAISARVAGLRTSLPAAVIVAAAGLALAGSVLVILLCFSFPGGQATAFPKR